MFADACDDVSVGLCFVSSIFYYVIQSHYGGL